MTLRKMLLKTINLKYINNNTRILITLIFSLFILKPIFSQEIIDENKIKLSMLQREGKLSEAGELAYSTIPLLEKKVQDLESFDNKKNSQLLSESVTTKDIARVVAKWTGIPINKMLESEKIKILKIREKHISRSLSIGHGKPLHISRGEMQYLYSKSGEKYLDFASGIAVNSVGHCHPHLVAEIQRQAAKLIHTSNLYNIIQQEKLAKRLCDLSFADKVFFANSGAEANEGAVKVARRYMHDIGRPERNVILCIEGCFHGRTLSMLSATSKVENRVGFGPLPEGFRHVNFNNLDKAILIFFLIYAVNTFFQVYLYII